MKLKKHTRVFLVLLILLWNFQFIIDYELSNDEKRKRRKSSKIMCCRIFDIYIHIIRGQLILGVTTVEMIVASFSWKHSVSYSKHSQVRWKHTYSKYHCVFVVSIQDLTEVFPSIFFYVGFCTRGDSHEEPAKNIFRESPLRLNSNNK